MACTNQSAVDFIKNARSPLVECLKNQKFIAEKLQELKVFNIHNVRAVTSEKDPSEQSRTILDLVTKKGEKASYVFLRILDGERNRTLLKGGSPDLHHWISCFPFKEEPDLQPTGSRSCQEYQTQLRNKAQKILDSHAEKNSSVLGSKVVKPFFYTSLVLVKTKEDSMTAKIKQKFKKNKKSRPKKLSAYIPKTITQLSPDDLLKCNEQNILLVGKPGIGKTTVVLEMINLWANMENRKLNYLFYFDEITLSGRLKPMSLKSLLFDAYVEPRLNRKEVLEDILENSEHVIIIVDGIKSVRRNSVLRRITEKDLLPEAKVVVTCRPDCEELLSIQTSYRVCVEGFNEKSIQSYLSHMLEKPDAVNSIMDNPELRSLCYVPVHALMVVASMVFPRAVIPSPCTVTEIYANIFRHLMKKCKQTLTLRNLNKFIQDNKKKVLDLSESAFCAVNQRSIILQGCEDSSILHNFLNQLIRQDGPTCVKTYGTFLHNTMQEFFAAIWLLANPGDIGGVFSQCKTDEGKHMRHVIPFLSGLLSERNLSLVSCLFPAEHIKMVSTRFIEQLLNTFISTQAELDSSEDTTEECTEELIFLCQCLFELQSPQACSVFLTRVNHHLDLVDACLDPFLYCTLSYVIRQAVSMKVVLDLEDWKVSKLELQLILDCWEHLRIDLCVLPQIWTASLNCEVSEVFLDLLKLSGAEMHLPISDSSVFERAAEMLQQNPQKINLVLHCDQSPQPLGNELWSAFLSVLPHVTSLRFSPPQLEGVSSEERVKSFPLELCRLAALYERESVLPTVRTLLTLFSVDNESDFLLDLYYYMRDCGSHTESLLPALQPIYQSIPSVWHIDLSVRKASLLLEVLKLQTQKKPVELRGWSDDESELRSFLQCLPYISQLRFSPPQFEGVSSEERVKSLCRLCRLAALYERESVLPTVRTLLTLFSVDNESDFLLDLYYYVRDCGSHTESLLPALQPIYQSIPSVWSIDLSVRKASLFLEVLKLQTQKKPVELRGWSDDESEVRSFLQCLPYISQLRFDLWDYSNKEVIPVLVNLSAAAAECDAATGERFSELLSSVCSYSTFPLEEREITQGNFLLDLYIKTCETETHRSVSSLLQSVLQSVPKVWSIDLSGRKTSLFQEVLKLQTQKKPVELIDWPDEESEVKSFLQCLPYISQLRLACWLYEDFEEVFQFLVTLSAAAAERDAATGERFSELLSSVCSYSTFPVEEFSQYFDQNKQIDFLLDFYIKTCKTETHRSDSSLLQSVLQPAPEVWFIDLSGRKASHLLEVLKLQTQKKPVVLRGWSDDESEVRSFLQCLPYISQLRFDLWDYSNKEVIPVLVNLSAAAAECDAATGERFSELLSSVCSYSTFPLEEREITQGNFLLDLYIKTCETETHRSVSSLLQSVLQSVPKVWSIDLSGRKTSLFHEVLKLQTQKKPVELIDWPDEESEVKSFLQCLPYISQLRLACWLYEDFEEVILFLVTLSATAAERDAATGERFSELLSSVCSYSTFPVGEFNHSFCQITQSDFLLDFYMKTCETEAHRSDSSLFQSMLQSAPAVWSVELSVRKASLLLEVLQLQTQKKPVELRGWPDEESEVRSLLQCLPYISQLRFDFMDHYGDPEEVIQFLVTLSAAAAECDAATGERFSELLSSVCSYSTFPLGEFEDDFEISQSDFLLDLYIKTCETETHISFSLLFQSVLQSAPAAWSIDLSKRKASLLLEVLKLQTQKKTVELRGWSDEESEVKSFLQCLPYISQLKFSPPQLEGVSSEERVKSFPLELCRLAALYERESVLPTVRTLLTLFSVDNESDFLLDLYYYVRDYGSHTESLLPALQPIYQSIPSVWSIDLSVRKASLFLEVLKLQTQKKPVELRGWSDVESEVRSFLQCLPYISQLRFSPPQLEGVSSEERVKSFPLELCRLAALYERESVLPTVRTLLTLFSVDNESDFLLDLYYYMRDCGSHTESLLPALQPIYQSIPAVWSIDLSVRKASLFLEVLKLQTQKKPVVLRGWSDDESEVRSFLQCLPYISQLRFDLWDYSNKEVIPVLVNLSAAAAECDAATGERFSELLSSVCSYSTFPLEEREITQGNFLLDLYIKTCETETHRSVSSLLQSVLQSVPKVWSIDLSGRKTSLFHEVLKLQTQKKPVELIDWPDEESEVKSFLQCLPYISQLRLACWLYEDFEEVILFLVTLSAAAAERDAATGERFSELLSSVCSYSTFPLEEREITQSDFLLDLYIKTCETETHRSVSSLLQTVLQSAPAVWSIDLSETKASLFLEVLKLQTQKKPVELIDWPDEKSEVRSLFQCLPYISKLSVFEECVKDDPENVFQFLVNLSVAAVVSDAATGERFSELLCSVFSFPFEEMEDWSYDLYNNDSHTAFLLDLCSRVKDTQINTDKSLLPALKPFYQSAPEVWSIDLSERKASLFLEVLKLQTQKKTVELRGWSGEEGEVRSFFQCLPYISQLSFHHGCNQKVFLLDCANVGSTEELIHLVQLLDNIELRQDMSNTECKSVGKVLSLAPTLDLTLTSQQISLTGVRLLFGGVTHLHKLRLNATMVMRLAGVMKTKRGLAPVTVKELSLDLNSAGVSQRALSRVLSCLTLLIRVCTVQCLDLTSCRVEGHFLIILLYHQLPLKLSLNKTHVRQLFRLTSQAQDVELTQSFLEKVGGNLTFCSLTQEVLQSLHQHHLGPVTVDFRKCKITERNAGKLLPLLDRIQFKRLPQDLVWSLIMEIYQTRSPQYVSSLLRSTENYINLTTRGLDAADCAALRFTLQHSQGVRLNLMWTSIPEGEVENLLQLLTNVSQLSVDRQLLLRFLHCCESSDVQQGAAASLLQALQYRLDLSCCSAMDLTQETQEPPLHLTPEDCRAVSMVIQRVRANPELTLMDCVLEEAGLEHLLSVLDIIHLRCSKVQLLQLLRLECVRRAVSLSHAVGGEVDLSHTVLNPKACGSLALFLEYSEGLSELDLSYCQLTDQCLGPLLQHLHKVQILDLSNNSITDDGAQLIHNTVTAAASIQTVRLFNNKIRNTGP